MRLGHRRLSVSRTEVSGSDFRRLRILKAEESVRSGNCGAWGLPVWRGLREREPVANFFRRSWHPCFFGTKKLVGYASTPEENGNCLVVSV